KDPEDVVQYAGTIMQMEASGAATGEELKSGRAQHTFLVPPQDVREAADGAFWIIQAGGIAPFRALPTRRMAASHDRVEEFQRTDSTVIVAGSVMTDEDPSRELEAIADSEGEPEK
ncbi:hypothetical protein ITJ64_18695, partial [Herbiconiux sp. VKM Ac-1786]|nr:hypothetical protein [Herbiconiux sp. VKM Ac-1786]